MKNSNMTILMMAYDPYCDLWGGFVKCKEKYWSDCSYPLVIATCGDVAVPNGVGQQIATGDNMEWTQRLHKALLEIDSPFVLLMLEDLFIDEKVDNKRVAKCLDFMEKHDIGHCRLCKDVKWQADYRGDSRYGEYLRGHAYRISTHPAIWKREYLLKLTEKPMDAWNFEYLVSYESNAYPESCVCVKRPIISFVNTVWRQKWTREGVSLCKREGIPIDFHIRAKHGLRSNFITDINKLIYHILGPDLITKMIIKKRKGNG